MWDDVCEWVGPFDSQYASHPPLPVTMQRPVHSFASILLRLLVGSVTSCDGDATPPDECDADAFEPEACGRALDARCR